MKHCNDTKAFIEYPKDIKNIYENIHKYTPNKKRNILIVFDNMIADMLNYRKLIPIVTQLFTRIIYFKHISCFYCTILFCCTQKYTKFYLLLYHENYKQ